MLADEASGTARDVVAVPLVGQIAAGEPIPVPDDMAGGAFAEQQPANATMQPRSCDPANVEVQGKLVGVLRQVA